MFQNPLVQTVLLFLGSYSIMTILKKRDPFGTVLTVIAGVVALIIWMLRYNRATLHNLYQNPVFKPVIDLVCQLTKEQPPIDAGSAPAMKPVMAQQAAAPQGPARPRAPVSARSYQPGAAGSPAPTSAAPQTPSTPLQLLTEVDFRLASQQIQQRLFGMNRIIDMVMLQAQRNVKMREKSAVTTALPPLGLFLFVGRQGLGKKTLGLEIGRRLYRGDSVASLDVGQPDATLEPIIASAATNPYQTFVIENIDRASPRVQTELLTIVAGQPLSTSSGARVSFRHCVFFLLIHRDPRGMEEAVISSERGGFTVAAERLASDTSLDNMLAQGLHGVIPFRLPDVTAQAEAVALIMENECRKYQLALGSISPAILAREVQEVSTAGSFTAAPIRVSRILSRAIHDAMDRQQTEVNVS
jgi:hypothetical protein